MTTLGTLESKCDETNLFIRYANYFPSICKIKNFIQLLWPSVVRWLEALMCIYMGDPGF